jgi:hypothetical protein
MSEAGSGQALCESQWCEVPTEHQKEDQIEKKCLVVWQRWGCDDLGEVVRFWSAGLRASEAGESAQ